MTRRTIAITITDQSESFVTPRLHLKAVGQGIDPDRVADYLDILADAIRTQGLTYEHAGWRITTTKEKN